MGRLEAVSIFLTCLWLLCYLAHFWNWARWIWLLKGAAFGYNILYYKEMVVKKTILANIPGNLK